MPNNNDTVAFKADAYLIDDDPRVNAMLAECRASVFVSYKRWYQRYGNNSRVTLAAMLTVLIDACQEPAKPFDPERSHMLCGTVHELASMVVEQTLTPEQLAVLVEAEQEANPLTDESADVPNNKRHLH